MVDDILQEMSPRFAKLYADTGRPSIPPERLGLRIGEGIALRVGDLDFHHKIIHVRQSVDSATRKVKACKSQTSSADLPMTTHLETQLRGYLTKYFRENGAGLLLVNKIGGPYSANKLREHHLHPLLEALGIPRGGYTRPAGFGFQSTETSPRMGKYLA